MTTTEEPTSYFSMPGTFHSEGVHPGLIRPPASPTTTANSPIFASAILTPASPSTPSALPRPNFKRRRPTGGSPASNKASSSATPAHPTTIEDRWNVPANLSSDDASNVARSYVLAGNLDTPGVAGLRGTIAGPGAPTDQGQLGESMFSDSDYRTILGSKRRREDMEIDHTAPSTIYTLPSHPSQKAPGWGSLAFSTLGGVVGKVWDFCWGSTFKGFHAGSGQGYDALHAANDGSADSPARDLPGAWNQDEDGLTGSEKTSPADDGNHAGVGESYNPSISYSRGSTPTRQPAKRRQTDRTDDLGRNWVVISNPAASGASPATGRPSMTRTVSSSRPRAVGQSPASRRVPSNSMSRPSGSSTPTTRLPARRSSSRGGRYSTNNGWEKPPAVSTASYASPRSSPARTPHESSFKEGLGASTPSRRRTAASTNPSLGTASGPHSSRSGHQRTNSNASAAATRSPHTLESFAPRRQSSKEAMDSRSKGSHDNAQNQSPRLTEEARRLAAKRRMEERDADMKMAAFNKRLQDMIRQGKEALGTTVDVEMNGPLDGAWEDDD